MHMLVGQEDLHKRDAPGEVTADGIVVCSTTAILQTTCVWLATYYAFDIVYPRRHNKFLVFLQKIVLGINDSDKIPMPVLSLSKRINEVVASGHTPRGPVSSSDPSSSVAASSCSHTPPTAFSSSAVESS